MLNVLSIALGLFAMLFAFTGLVPFLGSLNWIALPIAFVGAALGALSPRTSGRNFNLVILVVAAIRLSLGGGIL